MGYHAQCDTTQGAHAGHEPPPRCAQYALTATNASCLCRGEPKTFFASAKEISQASEYGNVPTQIASMGEDNYLKSVPRAASQSPLSSRLRICPGAGVAALARAVPIALEYRGVPGKTSSMLEYPTEVAFLHALRRVVPAVGGPPAIRVMPHRTHEREGAHGVRASVFHLGPAARKVFCFGPLTNGSTAVYPSRWPAGRRLSKPTAHQ